MQPTQYIVHLHYKCSIPVYACGQYISWLIKLSKFKCILFVGVYFLAACGDKLICPMEQYNSSYSLHDIGVSV